jgi:hypothetical protein
MFPLNAQAQIVYQGTSQGYVSFVDWSTLIPAGKQQVVLEIWSAPLTDVFAGYHTTSLCDPEYADGPRTGRRLLHDRGMFRNALLDLPAGEPGKQTYSSLFEKPASYDNCTPASPIGTYFDGALPAGESADWRLTITGVPESATWGMMILGFGVAGAALRRRTARRNSMARA